MDAPYPDVDTNYANPLRKDEGGCCGWNVESDRKKDRKGAIGGLSPVALVLFAVAAYDFVTDFLWIQELRALGKDAPESQAGWITSVWIASVVFVGITVVTNAVSVMQFLCRATAESKDSAALLFDHPITSSCLILLSILDLDPLKLLFDEQLVPSANNFLDRRNIVGTVLHDFPQLILQTISASFASTSTLLLALSFSGTILDIALQLSGSFALNSLAGRVTDEDLHVAVGGPARTRLPWYCILRGSWRSWAFSAWIGHALYFAGSILAVTFALATVFSHLQASREAGSGLFPSGVSGNGGAFLGALLTLFFFTLLWIARSTSVSTILGRGRSIPHQSAREIAAHRRVAGIIVLCALCSRLDVITAFAPPSKMGQAEIGAASAVYEALFLIPAAGCSFLLYLASTPSPFAFVPFFLTGLVLISIIRLFINAAIASSISPSTSVTESSREGNKARWKGILGNETNEKLSAELDPREGSDAGGGEEAEGWGSVWSGRRACWGLWVVMRPFGADHAERSRWWHRGFATFCWNGCGRAIPALLIVLAAIAAFPATLLQPQTSITARHLESCLKCVGMGNVEGVSLVSSGGLGDGVSSGLVLVETDKGRGFMLEYGWDRGDAAVVCSMLGFKDATPNSVNVLLSGERSFYDDAVANVGCNGDEESMDDCPFHFFQANEYSVSLAGVDCSPATNSTEYPPNRRVGDQYNCTLSSEYSYSYEDRASSGGYVAKSKEYCKAAADLRDGFLDMAASYSASSSEQQFETLDAFFKVAADRSEALELAALLLAAAAVLAIVGASVALLTRSSTHSDSRLLHPPPQAHITFDPSLPILTLCLSLFMLASVCLGLINLAPLRLRSQAAASLSTSSPLSPPTSFSLPVPLYLPYVVLAIGAMCGYITLRILARGPKPCDPYVRVELDRSKPKTLSIKHLNAIGASKEGEESEEREGKNDAERSRGVVLDYDLCSTHCMKGGACAPLEETTPASDPTDDCCAPQQRADGATCDCCVDDPSRCEGCKCSWTFIPLSTLPIIGFFGTFTAYAIVSFHSNAEVHETLLSFYILMPMMGTFLLISNAIAWSCANGGCNRTCPCALACVPCGVSPARSRLMGVLVAADLFFIFLVSLPFLLGGAVFAIVLLFLAVSSLYLQCDLARSESNFFLRPQAYKNPPESITHKDAEVV